MHDLPLSRDAREKRMAYMASATFDVLIIGDRLTGGVLYHEYLTDDARCVVTVLRAAKGKHKNCAYDPYILPC